MRFVNTRCKIQFNLLFIGLFSVSKFVHKRTRVKCGAPLYACTRDMSKKIRAPYTLFTNLRLLPS